MALQMNEIPYPGKLATPSKRLTAAKTTETDLTGATLLYTTPPAGALLTKLAASQVGAVTLCLLKAYVVKPDAPTLPQFKRNRVMVAASALETALRQTIDFDWSDASPWKLEGGDKIYVALGVAQAAGVDFAAEIEEFVEAV